MPESIMVFSASTGLNTKIDPARLPFDPQTGVQDLAVAYNVDHDPSGRISRRKGYTATAVTDNAHSLFCDNGDCFYVVSTSLKRLLPDMSTSSVATVTVGARVSYAQLESRTYWMNGFEKGYIENGVNNSWVRGTYYGPDTDRVLYDPPIGTILAYHSGRFYVAQSNFILYSDPYDLNAFDLARSFFPFQSPVRMMKPTSGGFWISDQRCIYFLAGTNPSEMQKIKSADYPAIQYTDAYLDLSKLTVMQMFGIGVIFTSTEGICVGTPTGQLINLTDKKVSYPSADEGCGLVIGNRFVTLLKP